MAQKNIPFIYFKNNTHKTKNSLGIYLTIRWWDKTFSDKLKSGDPILIQGTPAKVHAIWRRKITTDIMPMVRHNHHLGIETIDGLINHLLDCYPNVDVENTEFAFLYYRFDNKDTRPTEDAELDKAMEDVKLNIPKELISRNSEILAKICLEVNKSGLDANYGIGDYEVALTVGTLADFILKLAKDEKMKLKDQYEARFDKLVEHNDDLSAKLCNRDNEIDSLKGRIASLQEEFGDLESIFDALQAITLKDALNKINDILDENSEFTIRVRLKDQQIKDLRDEIWDCEENLGNVLKALEVFNSKEAITRIQNLIYAGKMQQLLPNQGEVNYLRQEVDSLRDVVRTILSDRPLTVDSCKKIIKIAEEISSAEAI